MATIWFVKEGEVQNGPAMATQPLDWCVSKLGLGPNNWVTDLVTKELRTGETVARDVPADRGFGCVLVQVGNDDLKDAGRTEWKTGFHLLDLDAMTTKKLFER